jgi:glycosyltransferase involved in cell wall biosynthesis
MTTVCLNMIVKDEAAVMLRAVASALGIVDSVVIVDTGSTDGTLEQLFGLERCQSVGRVHVFQRPWQDFATNRQEAMELARGSGAGYALILDADDTIEVDDGFTFGDLHEDGYAFEIIHGETRHWRTALVKLDVLWQWRGVLHEALYHPAGKFSPHLPGIRIRVGTGGARSKRPDREKYTEDAIILSAELERNPTDTRTAFYHAQSQRDAGFTHAAMNSYYMRAHMPGGWDAETYIAWLNYARLVQLNNYDHDAVIGAYLHAYEFRPKRAEAPYSLAFWLARLTPPRYELARVFASIAAALPMPEDLFVESSIYEWRARDELAVAYQQTGNRSKAAALCLLLLKDPRLPAEQRDRVLTNLRLCQ